MLLLFAMVVSLKAQTSPTKIVIRGTGLNRNASRVLKIGDQTIYDIASGRGLRLTILNKADISVVLDQSFDCYGASSFSETLASSLNSITKDQIGILTSWDAWEGNVTTNLDNAFLRLGLTNAMATKNGDSRRPYAAIFEGASNGEVTGKAVEVSCNQTNNMPYAEIRGYLIEGSFVATGNKSNALLKPQGDGVGAIVDYKGYLGVGTVRPSVTLEVLKGGSIVSTPENNLTAKFSDSNGWSGIGVYGKQDCGSFLHLGYVGNAKAVELVTYNNYFDIKTNGLSRFRVMENGNIGIGKTPDSSMKLDVAGTIRAEEILVEANGNTADFVFSDDYTLKSLTEVENYIKTHKHLPDIPSAEAMEKQGVNLAEMNKLLLQKVEELTLYNIQQVKEKKELEQRIERLEKVLLIKE